ncbi:protein FAM149A [Salvelinus fontinalis]|uniref:protein FAM149A n=1 Tax=Salvelinus fontinalis TaxID=8038 RepID=UPI002485FE09|nr:protein FAM149A [Salvelinus fontinalis]
MPAAAVTQGVPLNLGALPGSSLPLLVHPLHTDYCRLGEHSRGRALIVIGKKLVSERSIFSNPSLFTRGSQGGAIASQLSELSSYQSSCGGVTPERILTCWSETQSCATGLSTEQSSLYSWRYDEFDRVNTQRVRQLFSDVDELLYEGRVNSSSLGLQEECQEWNGHSPHLRILGNQLESPNQEGFQYVHRRVVASGGRGNAVLPPCVDKRENSGELCVEGHSLSPTPCTLQGETPLSHSLCDHSSLLQEEVYEAEGRMEEFLAYDAKDTEDEWVGQRGVWGSVGAAGRSGVPPVSPHTCIREAVADEAFDDMWREVVNSLGELLHKHWQRQITGQRGVLEALGGVLGDPSLHINSKCQRVPLSRGSNTRSMLLWSNCCPTTQASQVSSTFKLNLNGVMTIQAKPLQQRQHGFAEKSHCDLEDRPSRAPAPTVSPSRRACSTPSHRAPGPAQRGLPLPRLHICSRPSSTSRSTSSRGRARSCLSPRHTVPRHQVIRGTRLTTVTEGQPSPILSSIQNQRLLPLLHADQSELEPSVCTAAPMQLRGRILQGGHATVPISILPPLREPTLLLESLSRPNTTHTLRSDTPMKQLFTPMDFTCHMKTGKGPHPGDYALIGVTGFGVGITCSASNGFYESTMATRRRQRPPSSSVEGESGTEPLLLGVPHQRKVFGRFPGHVKKRLQVVLS